jgi:DNA-binding transcriptional LysR family regulator
VELRQLRYFLAVSEDLHFGRAAQRLHVSQPPLSVQIRRLEQELGVALFRRTTRNVELTDAGLVLKEKVREIVDAVDGLGDIAANATDEYRGAVRLGFVSSAGLSILPQALRTFREAYRGVQLELTELTSTQLVDSLHDGAIDVGVLRGHNRTPGITTTPVLEEELVVVLPADHDLAGCTSLSPEQLVDEPMVFVARRLMPDFFDAVVGTVRTATGGPTIVQEAVQQETLTGLVAAGVGYSVLAASTMLVPRPGVVYRPLNGRPQAPPLCIATRDQDRSALVELLVDHLAAAARDKTRHSEATRQCRSAESPMGH